MKKNESLSLDGRWSCRLDGEDFPAPFEVKLPGTTDTNKIGYPGPEGMRDYLSRKRVWIGKAVYTRTIHIPEAWIGQRIELFLERVLWKSVVRINGTPIGSRDGLCTPHRYRLDLSVERSGAHELSIEVDNSEQHPVGRPWGEVSICHAYTEHTQSIWNGVIGKIELQARPKVGIEDWQVRSTGDQSGFDHDVTIYNDDYVEKEALLVLCVEGKTLLEQTVRLSGRPYEKVAFSDGYSVPLWDEFSPHLARYRLEVICDGAHDQQERVSGQRWWSVESGRMKINGYTVFLRGTLDCAIFPETGHPPMGIDPWRKLLAKIRANGCNHIRYHSWCPPEAAFQAADELGLYLQVECPSWTELGLNESLDRFLDAETERILKTYSHHPSFCFLAIGNEPASETQHVHLQRWLERTKKRDGRLYCAASGWPVCRDSDFHVLLSVSRPLPAKPNEPKDADDVAEWQRNAVRTQPWGVGFKGILNRPRGGGKIHYEHALKVVDEPVVAHEVGQWCSFPLVEDFDAYDGAVLQPENYRMVWEDFKEAGLLPRLADYIRGSIDLAKLCYRVEIEASLATEGLAGIQLLGLQDFSGQGTASIGLLDTFWDPKPGYQPDDAASWWKAFMVLPRFENYVWAPDETCVIELLALRFAPDTDVAYSIEWSLRATKGEVLHSGCIQTPLLQNSRTLLKEKITSSCQAWPLNEALEFSLTVSKDGRVIQDAQWPLYACAGEACPENVQIVTEWNTEIRDAVIDGARVIYLPEPETLPGECTAFPPIFWNTRWTNKQPPHTLGLIIDHEHDAFDGLPSEKYQNWLWKDIVSGGRAFPLPNEAEPALVEVIPDWNEPQALALVQAGRLGQGLLVIGGFGYRPQEKRPATEAMISSIAKWMASAQSPSVPELELSQAMIEKLGL